ncbi:acyl-CoA dehydrogenase family protein [Micromonospora sp. NPDC051925]|uniref:acyl-CoA dehydrogenase family protein n=1 Tax=Micromonospora sp. NPDC051925 TaxID=3364288 RepID=UPI0037CAF81D
MTTKHADTRIPLSEAIDTVCVALRERSDDLAQPGDLPLWAADLLSRTGLVDLCLPHRLGGAGADLVDLVTTVERVSAVDAATGWCLFIYGTSPWLFAQAPADLTAEIFARPGTRVAGALAPTGAVRRDGDELLLDGRWAFGSGVNAAHWVALHAVLADTHPARSVFAVLPALDITSREPWDGLGLACSGSGMIGVRQVRVPVRRIIAGTTGPSAWPEPAFRMHFRATFAACSAVLLGIASAALDDFVELAGRKRPTFGGGLLAQQPLTQHVVAECWGALHSARALLYQSVERVQDACDTGAGPTILDQARLRIAMNNVRSACLSVVDRLHHAAGGGAALRANRFAQLLRDAHTASQHHMFSMEITGLAGAVLLGRDVSEGQL